MSDNKSNFFRIFSLVVAGSFLFSALAFAAAATPAERLSKGKQLYSQGKYDQAMDNFIDVFVSGNSEQIAEANEYVNMIHFAMGDVEAPKQVPYNSDIEDARKAKQGHGKVLFGDALPEEKLEAVKPSATAASQTADIPQTAFVEVPVKEQIVVEDSDLNYYSEEQKALRKENIDKDVALMTEQVLARLVKVKGLNIYMRGGAVDAIDIPSELIFSGDKTIYTPEAKAILDDVYSLMILSGTPSFVLLPPGSYSDNVSIQGVRQVVALNSYFINMGISTAKLHFNMGLTSEEPPAKFSDLEGISIVFDYTAKPVLKQKAAVKNSAPVLSLGMYPFESFTPADNQGMLVDFSVVEASAPVADWKIQIVQHAKDGKYYVVRQLSGKEAVYQQFFWNGKKQYFGQILPLGNYTVVLRAQDIDGKEKVVRRKVSLKGKEEVAPVAAKSPAAKQAVAADNLNYETPRLWNKPKSTQKSTAAIEGATASDNYVYGSEYDDSLAPATGAASDFPAPAADPYAASQPGQYNAVNTQPAPAADPYPAQQPADNSGYLPLDDANFDY